MKYKKILLSIVIVFGISLLGMAVYYQYVDGKGDIPTFKVIPEKPDDFSAYTREIEFGNVDLCTLREEYWKQPEFYGDSWDISKEKFYDNPDYSRWGIHGHGNLPNDIGFGVTNMKQGDSVELCTFFHNGFGVWTWQGFRLIPVVNQYGDLFEMEISPNEVMMDPTFPVFGEEWVKQIHIKITAKQDIPEGTYILGYDITSPTAEFSRDKRTEILYGEYENKELYKSECVKRLHDEERCDLLINLREKKYTEGGGYKTTESLMKISLIAEGNKYLKTTEEPVPVEEETNNEI